MKTFQITRPDETIREALTDKINNLTKPKGSLGTLEELALQIGLIQQTLTPELRHPQNIIFAADHGIVDEGVSLSPKEITWQQISNFLHGGAGVNFLCRQHGFELKIVDAGVDYDLPYEKGIINMKVRKSSRNYLYEAAMTEEEMNLCIERGAEVVRQCHAEGCNVLSLGEMGIGNTTTSAAVLACLLNLPVESVTGRGSGLTDEGFALKKRVISDAVALHKPNGADVLDVLSKVGGFDIAAMAGAFIGCALFGIPAVADGLISVTAALAAVRLCKTVRDFVFLSHASYEIGYRAAAAELGMEPWLNLNMRLGEGSGCPVAFQVMRAACAAMNDMATFEEASINDNYLENIRNESAFCVKTV